MLSDVEWANARTCWDQQPRTLFRSSRVQTLAIDLTASSLTLPYLALVTNPILSISILSYLICFTQVHCIYLGNYDRPPHLSISSACAARAPEISSVKRSTFAFSLLQASPGGPHWTRKKWIYDLNWFDLQCSKCHLPSNTWNLVGHEKEPSDCWKIIVMHFEPHCWGLNQVVVRPLNGTTVQYLLSLNMACSSRTLRSIEAWFRPLKKESYSVHTVNRRLPLAHQPMARKKSEHHRSTDIGKARHTINGRAEVLHPSSLKQSLPDQGTRYEMWEKLCWMHWNYLKLWK